MTKKYNLIRLREQGILVNCFRVMSESRHNISATRLHLPVISGAGEGLDARIHAVICTHK